MNDAITIKRFLRSELKEQLIQIRKLSRQLLLWILSIKDIKWKNITSENAILYLIDRAEQFFGIELYDEIEKEELKAQISIKLKKARRITKRVVKLILFPLVLPILLIGFNSKKQNKLNKKENFYNPT